MRQHNDGKAHDPSIGAQALRLVRRDILSLQLPPGARLVVSKLMDRYRLGAGPIREALTVLSGDGLVIFEPHRGFSVTLTSLSEFEDIATLRVTLEGIALRASILAGDEAWRVRVQYAKAAYDEVSERAGDPSPISLNWEDRHRLLTEAIIGACGSPILIRMCLQLHDRFDRYRRLTIPNIGEMAALALDEDELCACALRSDEEGATTVLSRHINMLADIIRPRLDASFM